MLNKLAAITLSLVVALDTSACETAFPRRVVDQLINVENDQAATTLAQWQQHEPEDPLPGFYRIVLQWAQVEAEWDRAARKTLAAEVSHLGEQYVTEMRSALAIHPTDARRRLGLGLGEALTGRAALEAGQWFRAYRFGRAGRDTLRQLIQDDPAQTDAYHVLGLYEFYTGSVPGYLHWLTALLDLSGDARLGIRYLERATQAAPAVAPEAMRTLLTEAMWSQTDRCRYWPLARQARSRYPGNPQFATVLEALAGECGRPREGLEDLEKARAQFRHEARLGPVFDRLELPLREAVGDVAWFERGTVPESPARWRLGHARALDQAGRRGEAKQVYQTLLANADTPPQIRRVAEDELAQPYRPAHEAESGPGIQMNDCIPAREIAEPVQTQEGSQ